MPNSMGSTGEATDQDMLAPDCSPIHPRLLGPGRFKHCLRLGYLLLQLSDSTFESCLLLAGLSVLSIGDPR